MRPEAFKLAWEATGDDLVKFPSEVLTLARIPADAHLFLSTCGLPRDAAPCLTFTSEGFEGWPIDRALYFVIGFEGAGDPLAIRPDGSIVGLNHDRGLAPYYVNRDVATLAEALLRYRDLVAEAQRLNGEDALDDSLPEMLTREFSRFLEASDPDALKAGTLWRAEASNW